MYNKIILSIIAFLFYLYRNLLLNYVDAINIGRDFEVI